MPKAVGSNFLDMVFNFTKPCFLATMTSVHADYSSYHQQEKLFSGILPSVFGLLKRLTLTRVKSFSLNLKSYIKNAIPTKFAVKHCNDRSDQIIWL